MTNTEPLRTGWTLDGQRIELVHQDSAFRIGTRWAWLLSYQALDDAADAFSTLEMLEGNPRQLARHIKQEIERTPRSTVARIPAQGRVANLVSCVERRLAGLRPRRCGSKGSVERWIPA